MIKHILSAISVCLLAGCTSQSIRGNHVHFTNSCEDTVFITVNEYSNNHNLDKFRTHYRLRPNESVEVLLYSSYGQDLDNVISEAYTLAISTKTGTATLHKQDLIERVAKASKKFEHGDTHWQFAAPDLCPVLVGG